MSCGNWGSDQCTGGTANADSYYNASYVPSYAFDDNLGTLWDSGSGFPHWIGYDFGAGNKKTIERIRVYQNTPAEWCSTFTIQGSNSTDAVWDSKSWTNIFTVTSGTHGIWENHVFSNSTNYRFMRLRATSGNDANYWGMYEIEMYKCQDTYYFSGYVYEQGSPIQRTLYLHNRSDGNLEDTTTSSGNGYYYLETTYSGAHYIVCLDDPAGEDYNDLIIGNVIPTTVSE